MNNEKNTQLDKRRESQPNAVLFFSDAEKKVIVDTVAKDLTTDQRNVFFYTCQALGLNPLLKEICAISYGGTMSIQVMRDGFLTIAHRSGKFAGIESGIKTEDKSVIGWAKVYHKDYKVPVYQEAELSEYSTGKNLWATKPHTMIKKVAEAMALRKAFNVSGVYSEGEMDKEVEIKTITPEEVAENKEDTRIIKYLQEAKTLEELEKVKPYVTPYLQQLYDTKEIEIREYAQKKEEEELAK